MATATLMAMVAIIVASLVLPVVLDRRSRRRAGINAQGVQELEVVIDGRYRPSVIVVKQGVPVRLNFARREGIKCSERLIFSRFHRDVHLPAFQTTPVEFVPSESGQFPFTCARGLYRGMLIVQETSQAAQRTVYRRQDAGGPVDVQAPVSAHSSCPEESAGEGAMLPLVRRAR